jgi:hypothetical protein
MTSSVGILAEQSGLDVFGIGGPTAAPFRSKMNPTGVIGIFGAGK